MIQAPQLHDPITRLIRSPFKRCDYFVSYGGGLGRTARYLLTISRALRDLPGLRIDYIASWILLSLAKYEEVNALPGGDVPTGLNGRAVKRRQHQDERYGGCSTTCTWNERTCRNGDYARQHRLKWTASAEYNAANGGVFNYGLALEDVCCWRPARCSSE